MISIKKILLSLASLPIILSAAEYQLSTHILDISKGGNAKNVKVELYKLENNNQWTKIDEKYTGENGRITDFLPYTNTQNTASGVYKLKFYTKDYFDKENTKSFYPYIEVGFEASKDQKHYHVPLTLSPFGYSTYRGS